MDVHHSTGTCPKCKQPNTLFGHGAEHLCYTCIRASVEGPLGYCWQCNCYEPYRVDARNAHRCIPCETKAKQQCSKCREWQPLERSFHVARNSATGRSKTCKSCIRAYQASPRGREVVEKSHAKRVALLEAQSTGVPVIEADILAECGDHCFYCSGPYHALDHLWPVSKKGPHDPSNLVPACRRCNSSKGRKHLLDFIWKVLVPEGIGASR
jgi:5-methylcytosine-specific restriction endonuclease McrA